MARKRTRKKKHQEAREYQISRSPLRPLTEKQADYISSLVTNSQTFVLGPAGTGKTYVPSKYAAQRLMLGQVDKVILTRPNVPGGRSLGYFPGTLEEKVAPWVVPYTDVFVEEMGRGAYDCALKNGDIDIVPFEVMRGRSFNNAFIILDEAQNTTVEEIKMFLTRIGSESQVVLNGDISQDDLKAESGFKVAIDIARRQAIPADIIEFTVDDIVRSDICAQWVKGFIAEGW